MFIKHIFMKISESEDWGNVFRIGERFLKQTVFNNRCVVNERLTRISIAIKGEVYNDPSQSYL